MKKLLLLFYFTLLFFSPLLWRGAGGEASAQNPLVKQWDKRFGGSAVDELYSFQQTTDGGYILGGRSYSGISGDKTQASQGQSDYWVVKTDALGALQWEKRFGGSGSDPLFVVKQTSDGGYILGGYSDSGISGDKTQANNGQNDYWIVKIDSLGAKQWDKTFGGTGNDALFALQQTTDGGYMLAGFSGSDIGGDKTTPLWDTCLNCVGRADFWIVKTDSAGTKQWDKDFGGLTTDNLHAMQQTADGGYVLAGFSTSGIGGNKTQATIGDNDYWIIKTDSLGNFQWDKDFGGTDDDWLFALHQTADAGYVIGGFSYSGIGGDKTQPFWDTCTSCSYHADYWIVKTDSLGAKQWDKDFGGFTLEDAFGNILQTTDGGYLLAGTSYSPVSGDKSENNLGTEQSWIIKTDALGIKQWDKTIFTNSGSIHDEVGYAIQTNEGCYAIANFTAGGIGGYKTQPSQGNEDYWLVKFCDSTLTSGLTPASPPDRSGGEGVAITPNPSSGNFTITLPQLITKGKVEIYNSFGEKIVTENISNASQKEIHLKTPQGIYFVKVMDARPDEHPFGRGEKQYSSKIIIE